MSQLIISSQNGYGTPGAHSEQRYFLRKQITTAGTAPTHDLLLPGPTAPTLIFTLVRKNQEFELLPADVRLRLNGQAVSRATRLRSCDRLEWEGAAGAKHAAVLLDSAGHLTQESEQAVSSLAILKNLAVTLQTPGSLPAAFQQAIQALVEMACAEAGCLLAELGSDSGWELVASSQSADAPFTRKQLFSNTILQEALKKRGPVYVENMIGHPWAEAQSVMEARIFSAACFPLIVGEQVLGAVFLLTRSPGRSIRRESLEDLSVIATQVALLLGLKSDLNRVRKENAQLRTLVHEWPENLLFKREPGASPMQEVARKIQKLAPTPLSVLILGETGTGKEVVAREIHRQSPRAKGAFVAVNCAAIPPTLLESTLFGHERGAFTGATRAQPGKFLLAHGGTLFLDEIGDLPLELQSKLLRVLQEKMIEPIGARSPLPIDVRILAATHQDIPGAIRSGRFRQDLFFRLNGATIEIPALRERRQDIALLARVFLERVNPSAGFTPEAQHALQAHAWPGNVRELEQVVTRAAYLADGGVIAPADLDLWANGTGATEDSRRLGELLDPKISLQEAQDAFTREYVEKALERHDGNRAATALSLGVSERTLYRILSDSPDREA